MELVIFNAALYIVALFAYWYKHKHFNFYILVLLIYAATACMCAYNYSLTPDLWNDLGIFPFIYLFIILLIFLFPLRKFDTHRIDIPEYESKWLKYLAYFYIIISITNVSVSIENTLLLLNSGEWGELRSEAYTDFDNIILYENQFQKIIKNLSGYLSPFAYVYTFYLLTQQKINKLFFLTLLLSLVASSFIAAAVVASRGMIVFVVVKLFVSYLLFERYIPKQNKKLFFLIAIIVLSLLLMYAIDVTQSRFGDEGTTDSLIFYFGHSMLSFNDGVFNNMHDYAYGKRFFKWFIDILGCDSEFNIAAAGATNGTAFFTFVGGIFIDWGPVVSIFVAIIAAMFISKFFRKKKLCLSDTVMIVFYVDFLVNGIYAYSSGRALIWIMTYIVYLIVNKLENGKTRQTYSFSCSANKK